MAIVSSKNSTPLGKTIFIGEVSLTGVIKNVFLAEKRIFEAAKLGFENIVIPEKYDGKIPKNVTIKKIKNISEIIT